MYDISRDSYAEAYTSFLVHCAKKEDKTVTELVFEFSGNGIEDDFEKLYLTEGV